MSALITLLDFAGYVALLLWGVHMVQTGVQRAFGAALGAALGRALGTRLRAFAAGLGITAALQSSTATGLMITGFAAGGVVGLVPALAAMLGANVGTTLIVQLLSFDLTSLAPILILAGVWMFRRYPPGRTRDLGRVFIGLGLLLLSLHQLVQLFEPFQSAPMLGMVLEALSTQPVVAVLLSAIFTWAAHSSVAVVVLVMSLASHHMVAPHVAFALVLGANLGTAINPMIEGVTGDDPAARRLPLGNLLTRALGVLAGLVALPLVQPLMNLLEADPARAVANFHTLFNAVIALVFLPVLAPYAALLTRWLPKRADPNDPSRPQYLDEWAHDVPAVALGNAAREALRMADMLQTLLLYARAGFKRDNRHRMVQARQLDGALDKLENAITTYLATLDQENMTRETCSAWTTSWPSSATSAMPATSPTTACSAMSPSCASKAGSRPNSAPAWKTRWASSSPTSARPPPCSSTTTCGKRARWRARRRAFAASRPRPRTRICNGSRPVKSTPPKWARCTWTSCAT